MKVPTRTRACSVAACLLLGVSSSFAQQTVSMAEAVEAAWRRTLDAAVTAGQLRQAQAEQTAAQAWWAGSPALELSHRTDRLQTNDGARETEVGLAVPLWLPGQRSARLGVADAEATAAHTAETLARWQLTGTLRELAAEVELRRAESGIADQEANAMRQLHIDVDRRVAAGDLARADALAAQAEWQAAASAGLRAREQRERAELQWQAATGLTAVATLPAPRAEPGDPATTDSHPQLLDARERVEVARRRLALVDSSQRSAPELVTRWRQETDRRGAPNAYSVGLALRIPFGTDDRNRPLQAQALQALDIAEAGLRQARWQVDAQAATQRLALATGVYLSEDEAHRASLLRERATLIDQSFQAGETALPDLLRARAAAAQAEASALRQRLASRLAMARLQQALGVHP